MNNSILSVVVPVLNEVENLPLLFEELENLEKSFEQKNVATQFIINDNCSNDGSSEFLNAWSSERTNVDLVKFPVRVSFQTSIIRGFKRAKGDCVAVFQSDLQDPPETLIELFEAWQDGARVAVGIPTNRHSSFILNLFRKTFYKLISKTHTKDLTVGFQDFYVLDISITQTLSNRNEKYQFIRGSLATEFGVDKVVDYERKIRLAGKSKFSFSSRYSLAIDALLVNSPRFIQLLALTGFAISGIAFIGVLSLISLAIFGQDFGAPGWASTTTLILLSLGIVLFFFSLTFEFLSRILVLLMSKSD